MVSIIIPIYNAEPYLEECLLSVLNSTYNNIEIILVNNGSTDNSLNICNDFAKKDFRIEIIDIKSKIGVSNARNIGIKKAKSKYIIFIDSDDIIHPDMIKYLRKTVEIGDIGICNYTIFKNKYFFNSYSTLNTKKVELKIKDLYNSIYYVPWNKIYKKELFNDILFPSYQTCEEEFTIYKILLKAKKILYIDNILYYYRNHNFNSITNENSILRAKDIVKVAYDKIEFFKKYKNGKYYQEAYKLTLNRLFHIRDCLYLRGKYKMCKYIDTHIERIGK